MMKTMNVLTIYEIEGEGPRTQGMTLNEAFMVGMEEGEHTEEAKILWEVASIPEDLTDRPVAWVWKSRHEEERLVFQRREAEQLEADGETVTWLRFRFI